MTQPTQDTQTAALEAADLAGRLDPSQEPHSIRCVAFEVDDKSRMPIDKCTCGSLARYAARLQQEASDLRAKVESFNYFRLKDGTEFVEVFEGHWVIHHPEFMNVHFASAANALAAYHKKMTQEN